jgi:hypothetical protein
VLDWDEKSAGKIWRNNQELEAVVESGGNWGVGTMGRGPEKKKRLASEDQMELSTTTNFKFRNFGSC